jgi:tetratricopeptide (TPR) repeat protein
MLRHKSLNKTLLLLTLFLASASCALAYRPRTEAANPQLAATMSLEQAKESVQYWKRWLLANGDAAKAHTVIVFTPEFIMAIDYHSDGSIVKTVGCSYEQFDPYIETDQSTFVAGKRNGERYFAVHSGAGSRCKHIGIAVPTHEAAQRTAAGLLRWKNATPAERTHFSADALQNFASIVSTYQAQTPRPQISEDVRRLRVIAEAAVEDKRFGDAANSYDDALALAPWWPNGHFNSALVLGELFYYDEAILHMQKYLALVPNDPDARAAQDKIYMWQGAQQALGAAVSTGGKR